ncbi:MAG: hypothetical protein EA446_02025 [Nitrosopumilus sp.]|nr:MAG: hypothetical protein EA446_02025 [Nitrosopumilus sp.]
MIEGIGLEVWAQIATAVATCVLVILLYFTIKQFESQVEVSRIQTEFRFRPWIGPTGPITKMEKSISEDCQFDIAIKNYGELPASKVTAKFVKSTEPLTRDAINSPTATSYDLGPVMPTMEKHYWFFIDSELWQKAEAGISPLHTVLYFEYDHSGKKNGYGMLSKYSPSAKNFIHSDMWIDS